MRAIRRIMLLPLLLSLALLGSAASVNASSVFDGTNADLWLVDEESGQVTGYDFNAWLDQFAPGGAPLYPLGNGEQALINLLQNSSVPMSANQPAISVVGIEPGMDGGNPDGHTDLVVLPADGTYDTTIAVRMMVNTQLLTLDPVELIWSVDGAPQQSVSLTKAKLSAPGGFEQGGYYVHTIHIAREGGHRINVQLYEPNILPGGPPRLVGSETRDYTLTAANPEGDARDEDGDGIPDVIEAEIGLDPNDDDWQKDTDGDGWSDFDEWLRTTCLDGALQPLPGTDCTDANGNPVDTDGDGWADFDEQVRGTNHLDAPFSPSFLLEDDETVTSASLQARVRSYKDFPQARRLYEVERLAAGTLPGIADEPLPADSIVVLTVLGDLTYDSDALLSDMDLSDVGLNSNSVPPRMQDTVASNELASSRVPSMRLPAGNSSVVNATYRSTDDTMNYRRIYKRWLTRRSDLSPLDFRTQAGPQDYPDAESWRSEFVAYLVANAVIQDPALAVDITGTTSVSMFEAALGRESRLNGLQDTQLLSRDLGVLDPNVVQLVRDGLSRIAGIDYSFDNAIAAYDGASQPGQALEPVAQWIETMFFSGLDGTQSDAFIASRFLGDPTNDYLVRLLQLPGAFPATSADVTLSDRLADSDADNANNGAELNVPLARVTLPWVADSDGDTIVDGNDECPIDPFNGCGSNPILPVITVGFDVVVAEPEAGSNVAIVSIILDRIVDFDVTIDYTAFVAAGDTAEGGTDFIEITGTVTIPAGERVALIAVPILADADAESPETFTIQITGVTGATIGDDGIVVVTINNTDPGANTAPVFTSIASASVVEGDTSTNYTATATDDDGDILAFSISGGTDQAEFTIDAASGVLSFAQPTDFDAPTDADANNDYEVQLTVDDGRGGTDTLDVVVTVLVQGGFSLQVSFPTAGANLGGEATQTTVMGNIVDGNGLPIDLADIDYVSVNGVNATLDMANPGRWSTQVPVSTGPNTLNLELGLTSGTIVNSSQLLDNFVIHVSFGRMDIDAAGNRLLLPNDVENSFDSIDLVSGVRSAISASGAGNGPDFDSPRDAAYDAANNRVLVPDWQLDALFAVDLASGDRSIISNNVVGTGVSLNGANYVALDNANNRALVVVGITNEIVAVDLASGDRTVFSGTSVGAGPDFDSLNDVVVDAANNRVLVSDNGLNAILAVDLGSGDRTVISDASTGTGPNISTPTAMDLDAVNGQLIVAELNGFLLAVDLATGNRSMLADLRPEFGLNGSDPRGIAIDGANNRALVADSDVQAIFAFDLTTGIRTVVTDSSTASGPPIANLTFGRSLELDNGNDRLLMTSANSLSVTAIALANGDRSILSDIGNTPGRVMVDKNTDRAVLNIGPVLYELDLNSGDRTLLSSNSGPGTGTSFSFVQGLFADFANDRVLVIDRDVLINVAIDSGDRSAISDAVTGSGPMWTNPRGLQVDLAQGLAYLSDLGTKSYIEVDLVTGDRRIVSDNAGVGAGPNIGNVGDIALDSTGGRLLGADGGGFGAEQGVIAVDLITGDRTLLLDTADVSYLRPDFLVLDTENERIFFQSGLLRGIVVYLPATGEWAVMSK